MNASDKRSLPWWPEEVASGSEKDVNWWPEEIISGSKKDVKGKEKVGSDLLITDSIHGFNLNNDGQPHDDVRIPITSASSSFSEEETVSREELAKILTPEPLPVHDDRVRRSSLWDSAVVINPASALDSGSRALSEDSEARRNEIREETKAGKRVASDEPPPLISLDSDVESQGRLEHKPAQLKEVDVLLHNLEIEKPANRVRSEMKLWVEKSDEKRNSMAERLSDLLKPRPPAPAAAVAEASNIVQAWKSASNASKEKPVAELKKLQVRKKKTTLAERMPPEWVLLLLGCVLGLSSGLSVVAFNKLEHFIHDVAWEGTPSEGASWLRLQKLADIWHRILLIPVVGGVVVGMLHTVTDVLDVVRASQPPPTVFSSRSRVDWLAALKPIILALQAAITLGSGLSLGPEGPAVDIGKRWAHGFSNIMKNSKERRIALVAAGAAAGIASGFNAPVAGTFFAIETVLRPQNAENSPPLTTAMIILAAVISSTVSQVLLGERPAFTVPPYELRSAAELPLYILLGGVCGIMSVVFTRLVAWFTRIFDFTKDQLGVPASVTPAIGALLTGVIALKYPGVLYWGFTNVDEILQVGFTSSAPGQGLLAQIIVFKIVATAMCKGSGLVGGLYAPSLFIGAASGALYGNIIGKAINAVMPGHNAVAHPQAYALVGMAALLAAVCSVPLTSVLLLFELTKDYHILLPLMGAVGLAIWVAAVGAKFKKCPGSKVPEQGLLPDGSSVIPPGRVWRRVSRVGGQGPDVELTTLNNDDDPNAIYISEAVLMNECKAADAMSKDFVKVNAMATVKESMGAMLAGGHCCALVVDENDLLEGIMTPSDLQREVLRAVEESIYSARPVVLELDSILVAATCTSSVENVSDGHSIVVCYPDTTLQAAEALMQPRGLQQLPVVTRVGRQWQDRGHKVVGVLHRCRIPKCIKDEAAKRIAAFIAQKAKEEDFSPLDDGKH
ncbi:hypothetical protein M758_12G161400 [Ceratodon purpureus]|nr:hypothetical protein M758_12G161400 [Ceratodon purpureus]